MWLTPPEVPVIVMVEVPAGVEAPVLIVSAEVPLPPVTGVGANEQLAPVGNPEEQVRLTSPLNPLAGVTVIVEGVLFPATTVAGVVAASEKSRTARLNVVVWTMLLGEDDVAVTVTVEFPAGVDVSAFTVNVEVSVLPVSVAGLNEQLAPAGRPAEQVSATSSPKLYKRVRVTVDVPEAPATTVADVAAVLKSGSLTPVILATKASVFPP